MDERDHLTERIIGAAIEVHRHVGAGLLESPYKRCFAMELASTGLRFEREKPLTLVYKGATIDKCYFADFVVEGEVVVEVKAVSALHEIHVAQLINYLKLAHCQRGLLLNFNVQRLTQGGIRRISV